MTLNLIDRNIEEINLNFISIFVDLSKAFDTIIYHNARAPFEQVFLICEIIFALNAGCYGFLKTARGLTSSTLVLQIDV